MMVMLPCGSGMETKCSLQLCNYARRKPQSANHRFMFPFQHKRAMIPSCMSSSRSLPVCNEFMKQGWGGTTPQVVRPCQEHIVIIVRGGVLCPKLTCAWPVSTYSMLQILIHINTTRNMLPSSAEGSSASTKAGRCIFWCIA